MLIELSMAGDVQVRRRLLRIGERALRARPAFEAIAALLMRLEREQFETEGKRSSGGWQPLKQSTIDAKGDSSILFDSGALMSSLSEDGDANMTKWATDDFLLFGSKLPYAGFHQTGTGEAKGDPHPGPDVKGLAQRRPLELKEADRVGVVKLLQAYILGGETAGSGMAAALGL